MLAVQFYGQVANYSCCFCGDPEARSKADRVREDEEGAMDGGEVIVEIRPQELVFPLELKTQSTCSVQLVNISKDFVAFKVKTTSPKKYNVRPNTGIILPRSFCKFTVTMQALKEFPTDMQVKDRFLVQSTVVPYGTTDEDIVRSFFSKDNGRYIQENKLSVFISPSHSLEVEHTKNILRPKLTDEIPVKDETSISTNTFLKNGLNTEVPFLSKSSISDNRSVTQDPNYESVILKESCIPRDQVLGGAVAFITSVVAKDIGELQVKVKSLEEKLNEAEKTIESLTEKNDSVIQDRHNLQQEIDVLRRKCTGKSHDGFPFLFVVFMALVGMALGYLFHS